MSATVCTRAGIRSMLGSVSAKALVIGCTVGLGMTACRPDPEPAPPTSPPSRPQATAPSTPAKVASDAEPSVSRPPGAIYRSELQRATRRGPAYLLRQLQPEPHRRAGMFRGWRITALFPDDPELCGPGCDLAIGDVIVSVNGNPLQRPEQLSTLLQALDHVEALTVVRIRDGVRETVVYPIVED